MCRGRGMQGRRPPLHISFVHHQETTHNIDSIAASNIKSTPLLQEITRASIAGSGLLIYSPRRHPADRASCDGVGLAIVAAIQAELHESEKPTSLGSGMINSIAAAGRRPLSNSPSPSAPPPHNISRPMPISLGQARQNKSLLPSLDSFTVNSKESKLSAHNCSNASCRWINHKSTHTNQRINNNVDDIRARESIFSTALSPPCSSFSSNLTPSPDFLGACFFCKRPLGPGKDIYMYRGDRAFCTTECRYQQIVVDERKERFLSTARKGNQASAINKPSHRLRVEATIAVFG